MLRAFRRSLALLVRVYRGAIQYVLYTADSCVSREHSTYCMCRAFRAGFIAQSNVATRVRTVQNCPVHYCILRSTA
jgi:hypothetical protein